MVSAGGCKLETAVQFTTTGYLYKASLFQVKIHA